MDLLFKIEAFMSKWAEDLVLEICLLAKESGHGVFNHLAQDNKFHKKRKLIDTTITFLKQIRAGTFLTMHGAFFTSLPEHVLEARRIPFVLKRVKQLQGNTDAIRNLLLRCVKNYFEALSPGADVPDYLKKYYPKTIEHFLLENNGMGSVKANFMLFYFAPDSAKQQVLENKIVWLQKKSMPAYVMAASFVDKIIKYHDDVKVREGYWHNINKLYKEFERLRNENKTSYSIPSCFDFVFKQADMLYDLYGGVNKHVKRMNAFPK